MSLRRMLPDNMGPAGGGQLGAAVGGVQAMHNGVPEPVGLTGRNEQAGASLIERFTQAADLGSDDG